MTDTWYGHTMAADEIAEFLNEQATGVLCLSKDRRAYGIPMSFAYDADEERAIMDLGFADDSKKREFLETTDEVCLTVYEWDGPHDWTSVVLSGSFEPLSESDVDDDLEAWYYRVAKDIDVSAGDVDLEWYELQAADLSGVALHE
ncbi:pyridoxamine 5'-phosphate oxidase family protein [Natronococcus sp. A-GB1]|uniref:pyridoxamine 5'-phosphate oxidase family protein n=1 Tax=Natronococcus sp. A-GB1 TaxID=3037648 RepID=UPI00241FDA66|nr:pyridoxamine 5'-phosphate oxidase family protein [Natronococcus sp. A-GB1]MDG5760210.1 pyridoxamine 5'-phosphate oxidase family protein [Natronococcus sp. A-GB1]